MKSAQNFLRVGFVYKGNVCHNRRVGDPVTRKQRVLHIITNKSRVLGRNFVVMPYSILTLSSTANGRLIPLMRADRRSDHRQSAKRHYYRKGHRYKIPALNYHVWNAEKQSKRMVYAVCAQLSASHNHWVAWNHWNRPDQYASVVSDHYLIFVTCRVALCKVA